jgi:8-oxo-dGTP diphosphatase
MEQPIKKPYCYQYPHPAVTVDCIIFALHENDLKVLLIQRKGEPFKECWALPGGFVEINEGIELAAQRELQEETGVENVFLEQLYTYGDPKRDPRERVISVAYYSLVKLDEHHIRPASDALNACWFPIRSLPKLAFDHDRIMDMAIRRLQGKVLYAPVIFELLPHKFRLDELEHVYELVLERDLDSEKFRNAMLDSGVLTALKENAPDVNGRPVTLYKFDRQRFARMQEGGVTFEFKPQTVKKKN